MISLHLLIIRLTQSDFEPVRFGFLDLPEQETGALLIQSSRLILMKYEI